MALINELRNQGDYLFKYRGFLPLLILIPTWIVFLCYNPEEDAVLGHYNEIIRYAGLVIGLIGLWIRCHVIAYSAPNTSGRNTDEGQMAEALNTTGMYSIVRHPLYVGNFLMWVGPVLWTVNFWYIAFFIVLYYLYYERIMYAEERFLQDKYGEKYMSWAGGRPAFVPRLKGYKSSTSKINFRKILNQERNGLLALFLIFFLFDLSKRIYENGWDSIKPNFWSISFVIVLIIFIILKSLKRSKLLSYT